MFGSFSHFGIISSKTKEGLAKSLCLHGKGISVQTLQCNLCQKSLNDKRDKEEQSVTVWGCGHCFHTTCISSFDGAVTCPQCRMLATCVSTQKPSTPSKHERGGDNLRLRPDLEGHF